LINGACIGIRIGHNALAFDGPIIFHLLRTHGITLNCRLLVWDSMALLQLPEFVNRMPRTAKRNTLQLKLETVFDHVFKAEQVYVAHRAFRDCEALITLLKRLYSDAQLNVLEHFAKLHAENTFEAKKQQFDAVDAGITTVRAQADAVTLGSGSGAHDEGSIRRPEDVLGQVALAALAAANARDRQDDDSDDDYAGIDWENFIIGCETQHQEQQEQQESEQEQQEAELSAASAAISSAIETPSEDPRHDVAPTQPSDTNSTSSRKRKRRVSRNTESANTATDASRGDVNPATDRANGEAARPPTTRRKTTKGTIIPICDGMEPVDE
jgi:hypothetical protein